MSIEPITYKLAFMPDSPVGKLYQKEKAEGAQDKDLDAGYPETDYVKQTRIITHQDQLIDETEVLNYALERYEQFQLEIEAVIGQPVPSSLDAKVSGQTNKTIAKFKQILTTEGLREGTDKYDELLALSLFAWASSKVIVSESVRQELLSVGLSEVIDYLAEHGGLGLSAFRGDCRTEATASAALAKKCGACTEQSNILLGVMRLAGLKVKPLSVVLAPGYLASKNIKVAPDEFHSSVSVDLGEKKRIFDPALGESDAEPFYKANKFVWWFEQTGTESFAVYLGNLGHDSTHNKQLKRAAAEIKTALRLDPNYVKAHQYLGNVYIKEGKLDPALAEYQTAVKLDPNFSEARYSLGSGYRLKGIRYERKKNRVDALKMFKEALASYQKAKELGAPVPREYFTELQGKINRQ